MWIAQSHLDIIYLVQNAAYYELDIMSTNIYVTPQVTRPYCKQYRGKTNDITRRIIHVSEVTSLQ